MEIRERPALALLDELDDPLQRHALSGFTYSRHALSLLVYTVSAISAPPIKGAESTSVNPAHRKFAKAVLYRQTFRRKDAPLNECDQYFPRDLISLTDHEVFVDCGAFVGDTVDSFLNHCGGRFNRVVCLEPDPVNFDALSKAHSDSRIVKLPAGAWSEKTTLQFQTGQGAGSAIADQISDHALAIPVVALDEVEACQDASFIKMDIEGAEIEALAGARQLIARCRPTLAICIYHSDEDMLRIPEHLLATLDRYSFHVRHHSRNWQETVLYALPIHRQRKT